MLPVLFCLLPPSVFCVSRSTVPDLWLLPVTLSLCVSLGTLPSSLPRLGFHIWGLSSPKTMGGWVLAYRSFN